MAHIQPDTSDVDLKSGDSEISAQHAKALVKLFAETTSSRNTQNFVDGFTEDCVVVFNGNILKGKAELAEFMSPRFSYFPESFVCNKKLRTISGNVLGVQWHSTWEIEGQSMEGFGMEYWVIEADRIKRWDAVYFQK